MGIKNEIMNKRTWAVVGVTDKTDRFGYKIWKILKKYDYVAYGISPKYDEIDGEIIYPKLKDLPETVEVVDIVVNPTIAAGVLREAKELGIEYIFFQPDTYDDKVIALADELGLKYILDDCVYATLKEIEKNGH
ncbi:MAG: CoA-binding protein [Tissierellia bacterium]|nr:CoA-binding protein [Tissierellia bacterium]